MEESETSNIEAAILAKLNPSTPEPIRNAPKPMLTKKRRKKRRKAPQVPLQQTVRHAITSAAKLAEERALSFALVRTQLPTSKDEETIPDSTDDSTVVTASGFCASARPRKSSNGTAIGKKISSSAPSYTKGSKSRDAFQFVEEFRREVGQFGAQALNKKDKKSYETAQLIRLGCRPPKNEKKPIGLLIAERKKKKMEEAKKKEMDLASGMLVRCKRKR